MGKAAIVAGTGFQNRDGSMRSKLIQHYVGVNTLVYLHRESSNKHDGCAIAVLIKVPILFGLLGSVKKKIGYIKAGTAKSLAKKIDANEEVKAHVDSLYAPPDREHPRVTLWLDSQ